MGGGDEGWSEGPPPMGILALVGHLMPEGGCSSVWSLSPVSLKAVLHVFLLSLRDLSFLLI